MNTVAVGGIAGRMKSLGKVYNEFPSQFWILVLGTFIDRLGGALLFPFFTLYLTKKFSIGMTEVGLIFGMFSISSVIGSFIGGALADRLGRKGMLIFGLVMSGLTSLLMGVVNRIELFLLVALVVGLLADVGGPAQQAMVADLLPEKKRAQGFGILRVVFNLSVTIGPIIGGLLASRSYLTLFICDAVTSMITAVIAYFALKESRQPLEEEQQAQSMAQTFRGYSNALRDVAFVWFIVASILMVLVYMQMNTTLAVFLRDSHGVPEQGFGYILSLNAAMVVLFQFPITRWVSKYRPLNVMAAGTLLYAIGFAMYGFVATYIFFLVAMAIITIGEMMVSPVGQAIVARLAPEDMRGRYMAVYGFSWVIPTAFGPLLAGMVMDNFNPNWLWYSAGLVGLAAVFVFYGLEWRVGRSKWAAIDQRLDIIQKLEEGKISAEEANRLLEGVGEGVWAKLSTPEPEEKPQRRQVRIRVSDLVTGTMKADLKLPMGLINTVLYAGGHLSADLAEYDVQSLRQLFDHSAGDQKLKRMDLDDQRFEVDVE